MSSINSINSAITTATQYTAPAAEKKTGAAAEKKEESSFASAGAVYEKSEETSAAKGAVKADRSDLIAKLKAEADKQTEQLRSIVEQLMTGQGKAYAIANDDDSMWKFLASGEFTVDAATKAQAQADIAEDGYWGVEKTSDRILDFAKALAGDDPSKAEELLSAFEEGFKQATGSWGKELPQISQDTYAAVHQKFDEWKKSGSNPTVVTEA